MGVLLIRTTAKPTTPIDKAVAEALCISKYFDETVNLKFNGIRLICKYGMEADDIVNDYTRRLQKKSGKGA